MVYCDKSKFRELIQTYQYLSDDVDDSWLDNYKVILPKKDMTEEQLAKFKTNKENFIVWKKSQYEEKKKRLAKETEKQKSERHKTLRRIEDDLCEMVFKIIDGVLSTSSFFKVKSDYDLMEDMRADAALVVWKYIDRFDSRKQNPFAYFTEVIKNSMNLSRRKEYSYRLSNISFSFIESFDSDADEFSTEDTISKIPKFVVNDVKKEREQIIGSMAKFMEGGDEDSSVG